MFEHILNLSIDLVHLATHRELFMVLLTFKSRRFFIEIINQFSIQNFDNDLILVRKYADLLNLLDSKEVFAYKAGSASQPISINTIPHNNSSGSLSSLATNSLLRNSGSAQLNKDNLGEAAWTFQNFKDSFYELVYKFPNPVYLKDNCINNCIDYYLQKKLLPAFGVESLNGIKDLLEKYFSIKNKHTCFVRKFLIDTLHKRIKSFYQNDNSTFAHDLIGNILLPIFELSVEEDDLHYRSFVDQQQESNHLQIFTELFEMKNFIVMKLIELTDICHDENNLISIVKIFEKVSFVTFILGSFTKIRNSPVKIYIF